MPVVIWGSYQQTAADDAYERLHMFNLTYLIMYAILRRHVSEFSAEACFGTSGQLGAAKRSKKIPTYSDGNVQKLRFQ